MKADEAAARPTDQELEREVEAAVDAARVDVGVLELHHRMFVERIRAATSRREEEP